MCNEHTIVTLLFLVTEESDLRFAESFFHNKAAI